MLRRKWRLAAVCLTAAACLAALGAVRFFAVKNRSVGTILAGAAVPTPASFGLAPRSSAFPVVHGSPAWATATPPSTEAPTLAPSGTRTPTALPTSTSTPTPLPWRTLAQCDTLTDPGRYFLNANLSSGDTCIRIESDHVTLECAGHSLHGTNLAGYGIAVHKSGLWGPQTLSDIEIRNCSVSHFRYGIYGEDVRHLVVRGNVSSENYDDIDPTNRFGVFLGLVEGGGIRLNRTADSQILDNTANRQAIGIDVRDSTQIVVRGNTASGNSAWGINILGTQNSEISNNTVADNIRVCAWGNGSVVSGCDAAGIMLQAGSSRNTVESNLVTGKNGNGIFIRAHALRCGDNNIIAGNTIVSAEYNAIELGFCTGNQIKNNYMRGSTDGVWLGFGRDTDIVDNTIALMSNHGIISENSHDINIAGNTIVNSNEGVYLFSDDYDRVIFGFLPPGDYRSYDNTIRDNVFQSNATVAIHLKDSTYYQIGGNTFLDSRHDILTEAADSGNRVQ